MPKVNVTDLRRHLPGYIKRVQRGEHIQITVHGKAVARLVPEKDMIEKANKALMPWRDSAQIGDVVSPIGEAWEVEREHL